MWNWLAKAMRTIRHECSSTQRVYVKSSRYTRMAPEMTDAERAALDRAFGHMEQAFKELDDVFGDGWFK